MSDNPSEQAKKNRASRQSLQDALNKTYNAEEENRKLKDTESPTEVQDSSIKAKMKADSEEALTASIKAYNALFMNQDGSYKTGYAKPEVDENGNTTLTFPTEKDAVNFFVDRAEAREQFGVYDASEPDKLIAFSNGDGHLRRPPKPDGAIIEKGDLFEKPQQQSIEINPGL
ncbi:MAG: hypothetical protein P1U61_03705 [Legionellaceae bacterium]|nr:hypothetical protein [Legionellaceae bacterium]